MPPAAQARTCLTTNGHRFTVDRLIERAVLVTYLLTYLLIYITHSVSVFFVKQEFAANADRDGDRHQYFRSPFIARYVRIHPVVWHRHISMRAGLVGCPFTGQ